MLESFMFSESNQNLNVNPNLQNFYYHFAKNHYFAQLLSSRLSFLNAFMRPLSIFCQLHFTSAPFFSSISAYYLGHSNF